MTETSLLVDWADGRGYLELVESPYEPLHHDEAGDHLEGVDVVANTVLQQFEAKLRPYDLDAAEKGLRTTWLIGVDVPSQCRTTWIF